MTTHNPSDEIRQIHRIHDDSTKLPFTSQEEYCVLGNRQEEPDYQNSLSSQIIEIVSAHL
jgi:hypothetical protein